MRIIPTVHLNGTTVMVLDEQYSSMLDGIDEALRKLSDAAPNARDYYPQGPGAFEKAREQYSRRWQTLVDLKSEITDDFLEFLGSTGR